MYKEVSSDQDSSKHNEGVNCTCVNVGNMTNNTSRPLMDLCRVLEVNGDYYSFNILMLEIN
ncbi:hypothetical protein E2C01_009223 [Portunus trituberculatus]|uniref:Uncharacterized protein n=1 Tax=Portunus trituberculatus TaxID=210409 RepID=A0A5B7D417_PORTR|nr:hypothetical protein [Portunus trituberculatus]